MKTYNVDYVRDESEWWVASIREVPGCHSQGRTLKEARERVREALGLFIDDERSVDLLDDPLV